MHALSITQHQSQSAKELTVGAKWQLRLQAGKWLYTPAHQVSADTAAAFWLAEQQ